MEILFAVGIVVLFVITWVVIACSSAPIPVPNYEDFSYVRKLEREQRNLEDENRRLQREMWAMSGRPCHCKETRYFATSQNEQKLTDLLTTSATAAQKIHDQILKEITN